MTLAPVRAPTKPWVVETGNPRTVASMTVAPAPNKTASRKSSEVAIASGTIPLPEATALGVFAGIRAIARRLHKEQLSSVTVALQGLGEVGLRLAGMLSAAGARLKLSDVHPDRAQKAAQEFGAEVVPATEIHKTDCDIFAPCALGGVIQDETLSELRAKPALAPYFAFSSRLVLVLEGEVFEVQAHEVRRGH